MDIFSYFNSPEMASFVRDNGEKPGFKLDAAACAYIVYLCDHVTLEQKVAAWEEILKLPDCEMAKYHDTLYVPSMHDFLRKYIDLQRRKLELFAEPDGCVFYLSRTWSTHDPNAHVLPGGAYWAECGFDPFSTLEGCLEYVREEWPREDAEHDRFRIGKMRVDAGNDFRECSVTLDGRLNVVDVDMDGQLSEGEMDIDTQFDYWFLRLPCPFRKGDIVVDATDPLARPFVFDQLKFWNSKELKAHGCPLSEKRAEWIDRNVAKNDGSGCWDNSDMAALGYQLASEDGLLPIDDRGCLYYDIFGACNNYINLKRYEGPFEGERRLLQLVSNHVRGTLDIEAVLNFAQLIQFDSRAAKLKRDFDRDYDESVRRLYGGQSGGWGDALNDGCMEGS